MAIAKISKLNLIAMSYDKDKLLNALQKTNAVEVKLHKEEETGIKLKVYFYSSASLYSFGFMAVLKYKYCRIPVMTKLTPKKMKIP